MSELAELERRISAALTRIGDGLDRLAALPDAAVPEPDPVADAGAAAEIAALQAALDAERALVARLQAQPAAAPADDDTDALRAQVEALTRQLDVQGLEMQRLRQTTIQLRESLRQLRDQQQGEVEPHLINKALLAEIEALRAARSSELAELDAILSELAPVLAPDVAPAAVKESPDA